MTKTKNEVGFTTVSGAARALYMCLQAKKYDDPDFWPAATLLFGDRNTIAWAKGGGYAKLADALHENMTVFKDAETTGIGFLARLYTLWGNGAFVDDSGKNLLEISKDSDGKWDFGISADNKALIAEKMEISDAVLDICLVAVWAGKDIKNIGIDAALERISVSTKDSNGNAKTVTELWSEVDSAIDNGLLMTAITKEKVM